MVYDDDATYQSVEVHEIVRFVNYEVRNILNQNKVDLFRIIVNGKHEGSFEWIGIDYTSQRDMEIIRSCLYYL